MFKSLLNITTDVVKIASAPVEIALDTTRAVTKPVADLCEETVKEIKEVTTTERRD